MKNSFSKLLCTSIVFCMFLSLASSVLAQTNTTKPKTQKKEHRLVKVLGNKKAAGQDYALESTAAVSGGEKEGIKNVNNVTLTDTTEELYTDSKEKVINTIDKFTESETKK